MKMNFLKAAQEYTLAKGDDNWFCQLYCFYREEENIQNSVYLTLETLYGSEVASEVESKSALV